MPTNDDDATWDVNQGPSGATARYGLAQSPVIWPVLPQVSQASQASQPYRPRSSQSNVVQQEMMGRCDTAADRQSACLPTSFQCVRAVREQQPSQDEEDERW